MMSDDTREGREQECHQPPWTLPGCLSDGPSSCVCSVCSYTSTVDEELLLRNEAISLPILKASKYNRIRSFTFYFFKACPLCAQ